VEQRGYRRGKGRRGKVRAGGSRGPISKGQEWDPPPDSAVGTYNLQHSPRLPSWISAAYFEGKERGREKT